MADGDNSAPERADTTTATTATTPAAPAAPASTTIASGAGTDTTAATTATTTTTTAADTTAQSNWRAEMAGDDKDAAKRLERFTKPSDLYKSYRSLETKLSSGEYRRNLPENASAEELATWRKENGVPDKTEGYVEKLALPQGIVLGAEDKPIVDAFASMVHDKNWTPAQFNEAVSWYYQTQTAQAAARQQADADFMSRTEDQLRTDWGADYRRNMNVLGSIRDMMPESLQGRLMGGRTADGRLIGDDPEMLGWLVQLGRELNPAATLLPAGTSDPAKGVQDELNQIREMRRNDPNAYDANKALQAREIELLDAVAKLKSRAA